MIKNITLFILTWLAFTLNAQDTLTSVQKEFEFKGQLSGWGHFNPNNTYPLYLGLRYIPQANYKLQYPKTKLIDFEASINWVDNLGIHTDSTDLDWNIKPYRLWARYSSKQIEFRVGLQKIDFGTAVMLRSLRWFDQVDPRDPLQLTDGVYGGLLRYYFLNNANIWLWGLYGNKNKKGMEVLKTNYSTPEFGGRIQFPIPRGESGISFHHRIADGDKLALTHPDLYEIPENRMGIDAKWDLVIGLWIEGAWVRKNQNIGSLTNQEVFTLGTDYTFGLGSGLNVTLEHMLFATDENPFRFENNNNNTAFSVRYPIGMFDNISAIIYYNWESKSVYNFVNWYKQFNKSTLYLMGYWNPENTDLPTGGAENLYEGKGLMLMFVYNH